MIPSQDFERRVLEHLATLRRVRGTTQAPLTKALGVGRAQITRRFQGKIRLTAGELLTILETMGVEPVEFFVGVTGGFHDEMYLARLELRHPRQVKYVKTDLLCDPPLNPYSADEVREAASGLQELRLLDAGAARSQALGVLRTLRHTAVKADPRTECETRVALGAIYRARGSYGSAAFFLREALYFAGRDSSLKARTLQAVMSLACDQCDFEEAFAAVQKAIAECAGADDWHGVGRALVSLGQFYIYTDDLRAAVAAFRKSLLHLPRDEWYGRYAAYRNLGLCHAYGGRLKKALADSEQALKLLASKAADAPLLRSSTLWLRGEIFLRMDRLKMAITDFHAVLEVYLGARFRPLDTALIAIRLAHVYLLTGNSEDLSLLVSRLSPMVERLEKSDRLLAASFGEFLRLAKRSEISVEILEQIYREVLRGAGEAPPAAQLAVAP